MSITLFKRADCESGKENEEKDSKRKKSTEKESNPNEKGWKSKKWEHSLNIKGMERNKRKDPKERTSDARFCTFKRRPISSILVNKMGEDADFSEIRMETKQKLEKLAKLCAKKTNVSQALDEVGMSSKTAYKPLHKKYWKQKQLEYEEQKEKEEREKMKARTEIDTEEFYRFYDLVKQGEKPLEAGRKMNLPPGKVKQYTEKLKELEDIVVLTQEQLEEKRKKAKSEGKEKAYDKRYEKGYQKGKDDWKFWIECSNCGKKLYIQPSSTFHSLFLRTLKGKELLCEECSKRVDEINRVPIAGTSPEWTSKY